MRDAIGAELAVVFAALVTAACGGSGATSSHGGRYTDADGWTVTYPAGFHVERSEAHGRLFISEVTFSTFESRKPIETGPTEDGFFMKVDPPLDDDGRFPADAVAFRISRRAGGPATVLDVPETRFPLRLADFEPGMQGVDASGVQPLAHYVVANGRVHLAEAWIGSEAPAERRQALAELVASLRFRELTPGTVVGDGFKVLERASSYPIGSFTRVRAGDPFYLVHAPGGFYALGWRSQTIAGGYKSLCELRLERPRLEFSCSNMRARWDRVGRVLERPPSATVDDPLNMAIAKVAHDGHVLLHPGVSRFAGRRIAAQLWPRWAQPRRK